VLSISDLALAAYDWVTINLGPEVLVAFFTVVMLIAMVKYDDRKRAKRNAESQPSAG